MKGSHSAAANEKFLKKKEILCGFKMDINVTNKVQIRHRRHGSLNPADPNSL